MHTVCGNCLSPVLAARREHAAQPGCTSVGVLADLRIN